MVLGMPFLILSGADVDFPKRELWWRSYTIEEAFLTTKRVKLVGNKQFVATALYPGYETFVVCVAFFKSLSSTQKSDIHLFCRAQIAALVANKAFTSIPIEYSDFANVFSLELVSELSEHIRINDHVIELVDDW